MRRSKQKRSILPVMLMYVVQNSQNLFLWNQPRPEWRRLLEQHHWTHADAIRWGLSTKSAFHYNQIYCKLNHSPDVNFSSLSMNRRIPARKPVPPVPSSYSRPPLIAKYSDLMALCSGANPVIRDRSQQQLFKDIAHG